MNSMPEELDKLERQIRQLEIEREAIKRENDESKLKELNIEISNLVVERDTLKAKWKQEKDLVEKVQNSKAVIEDLKQQAEKLREHIVASKYPVIVCGDFNDTPNSYVYAVLSKGMIDTFREKGLGPGTTFAGDLPLLRIDYILTEKSMATYSCKVARDAVFSDHYPVFSSVGF